MALPIARRAWRASHPLVGAFVVGAIAYGGLYTFPAISVAFADEFGISRTLAVTPWTMFLVVTAVASPLLGRAYDEWADRDLLTASMVLLAAGWLALYLAQEISLVILAYAVFMALGLQLSFIGTSTAIARRYAGMSGLALGIAYAGPGIGVAIALPVAGGLIATAGWRSTSLVFLASCLVGVAFVWLMTSGPAIVVPARRAERRRSSAPSDVGGPFRVSGDRQDARGPGRPVPGSEVATFLASPSGRPSLALGEPMSAGQLDVRGTEAVQARVATGLHEVSAPGAVSAAREIQPVGSGEHPRSIRRVVRTRRFWLLFAGAAAIGVFDEGVLQAFIPSAIKVGLGAGWAATALGLQSLAYVVGQILGGWLSDHVGRRIVGVAAAAAVAGGVVASLGLVGAVPAVAAAGIIVHGLGTGATIAVRSAAFGDVFGGPNFATIFGLLGVAYPIGGTLAVYLGAVALDATGSYAPLIPVILGSLVLWSVALWIAGPRRVRSGTPQPAS
ncbi:MAG TPA: MFS transporter [Candidatus Limnocylindrales bacterium]|nr:MFS transporter [Candidatus Limnocylindrales bacterium]